MRSTKATRQKKAPLVDWKDPQTQLRLKYAFWGSLLFCLAAHAYVFLNFFPRHDTLNYIDWFAGVWEIQLGRFVQPLYKHLLRGSYLIPWMQGMLTILYTAAASFFICEILDIRNRWMVLVSAGLMVANAAVTDVTHAFLYMVDANALAMLLACAGAFVIIRRTGLSGSALAAACFVLSAGIYQSQVFFGGLLLILHAMKQALQEKRLWKAEWRRWLWFVITVALSAGLYAACMRVTLWLNGLGWGSTYNSPAALALLTLPEVLEAVKHACTGFAAFFFGLWQPETTMFTLANIVLFALSAALLAAYAWQQRLPLFNVLVLAAGAASFPVLAQMMGILLLSDSIVFMTSHPLFLMYPGLLGMISSLRIGREEAQRAVPLYERSPRLRALTLVLCGCLLFSSVRFSNEIYTFLQVQYDKTLTHVTRIMDDIDETPGYEYNETEIVCIGTLNYALQNLNQPEAYRWLRGTGGAAATTYPLTFRSFVHMMGEKMNLSLDQAYADELKKTPVVEAMPYYPRSGYCQMVGDQLVVKLSPWW